MKIRQYQVDAFTSRLFQGNPAAVCPLEAWLNDETLLAIAGENNLSETAFLVPSENGFQLRWFTPTVEVDLCGHATLASAHVLFNVLGYPKRIVLFETKSGDLIAEKRGEFIAINLPAQPPQWFLIPTFLVEGLGASPSEVWVAEDYLAVFDFEDDIRAIEPDPAKLKQLDRRGVIATAPGYKVDFVSRFFAPKFGILEDPVTGSAHCELVPYWHTRLHKNKLSARQLSRRGGEIFCEIEEGRVILSGQAVLFMEGEIFLEEKGYP